MKKSELVAWVTTFPFLENIIQDHWNDPKMVAEIKLGEFVPADWSKRILGSTISRGAAFHQEETERMFVVTNGVPERIECKEYYYYEQVCGDTEEIDGQPIGDLLAKYPEAKYFVHTRLLLDNLGHMNWNVGLDEEECVYRQGKCVQILKVSSVDEGKDLKSADTVDELIQRYPSIKSLPISVRDIRGIKIDSLTSEHLERVLRSIDTHYGGYFVEDSLFAVQDGLTRYVPAQQMSENDGNFPETWEGEPILDALEGFENTELFIFTHDVRGDAAEQESLANGIHIEVWEVPEDFSIATEIAKAKQEALQAVKALAAAYL